MKRKAKTVLGLLILSVLVLSGGTAGNKISVQAETKKSIDFYIFKDLRYDFLSSVIL